MQRIVQRSELRSSDGSPSLSPDPEANARFLQLQQLDYVQPGEANKIMNDVEDDAVDGDEMEFCLFASSKPTANQRESTATQKIRLRSPSPATGVSGFVRAERDPSYYFTEATPLPADEDLSSAAVTGEQVLARSRSVWPGSRYSWKVLTIPASNQSKDINQPGPLLFQRLVSDKAPTKRTRPGKKYRVKVRIRKADKESKQKAAKALADAKEAAEREKRTRRNREKKVKKKMREKVKKAAGANEQEVVTSVSGESE